MEVCYWALLFMPLVILHHLLKESVQLANKRGFKQNKQKMFYCLASRDLSCFVALFLGSGASFSLCVVLMVKSIGGRWVHPSYCPHVQV
jgi:cellobiose-specific phosphotransferase system component IIC